MYTVKTLISIDSYSPGRRVAIRLDGGTNINGENGAGKTTLLRMIPLFYGAAPGHIVRQAGSNKSFVDYYLPRSTSYLVFEYLRDDELCMVVVSRKGDLVGYRFVKGGYRDELFFRVSSTHGESDEPRTGLVVDSAHWSAHARTYGYQPESAVGVDKYKLIIQSRQHYKGGHDRRDVKLINQYRNQYSFCRRGGNIENIDLIITSILGREPSIDSIKEVLSSILDQEGSGNIAPPADLSTGALQSWLTSREAYAVMERQGDRIIQLAELRTEYDLTLSQLRVLKRSALQLQERLETTYSEKDQATNTAYANLEEARSDYLREDEMHKEAVSTVKADLGSATKQLKSLDDGMAEYQRIDMERLAKEVERIPKTQESLSKLNDRYDALVAGAGPIRSRYENLMDETNQQHTEDLRRIQDVSQQVQREAGKRREEERKLLPPRLEELRKQHDQSLNALNDELTNLREQRAALIEQEKNVPVPDKLAEEARQIDSDLRRLHDGTSAFYLAIRAAEEDVRKQNDLLDKITEQRQALSQEKVRLQEEKTRILALHKADPKSLLAYLRSNHPDWVHTIAKVVPESLLQRIDLAPELSSGSGRADLYGVHLDLSGVEAQLAADEGEIQSQLIEMDGRMANLDQQIEGINGEYAKGVRHKKTLEDATENARARQRSHDSDIAAKNDVLKRISLQIEQAVILEREQIQRKIHSLDERITRQVDIIRQEKADHQSEADRLAAEMEAKLADINNMERERLSALAQDELERKSSHKSMMAQYQQAMENELIGKGVDPKTLETISGQMNPMKEELDRAHKHQVAVQEYREWLRSSWSTRNELEKQQHEHRARKQEMESQWRIKKEAWTHKKQSLEETHNELKKQRIELRKKIDEIESLLEMQMTEIPPSEQAASVSETDTPASLGSQFKDARETLREHLRHGYRIYGAVVRDIQGYPGTSPCDYVLGYKRAVEQEENEPERHWLGAAHALREYMETEHAKHLMLLQGDAKARGSNLRDYFESLKLADSSITSLGKRVSKRTGEVIQGFDSIGDLSIDVRSAIRQLDFWKSLERFSDSFKRWESLSEKSGQGLPDDQFVDRLTQVVGSIEKIGLSVNLVNQFNIVIAVKDGDGTKVARNDKELENISSNGLSYLVLIFIYTALTNMLRGETQASIIWSIDELLNFSKENIRRVMALLEKHDISICSAFPDPDDELLSLFKNRYLVKADRSIREYSDHKADTVNARLAALLDEEDTEPVLQEDA